MFTQKNDIKKTAAKISDHMGNLIQMVKFSASSAVTTIVDFLSFTLLYISTSNIIFSNVTARAISATVNFAINRTLIFKDTDDIKKTAIKFFASAAAILAVKTTCLKIMVDYMGLNAYISKGMVGAAFFLVNWMVQKFVVFSRPDSK